MDKVDISYVHNVYIIISNNLVLIDSIQNTGLYLGTFTYAGMFVVICFDRQTVVMCDEL